MSGGIRDDESLEAAMATGCRRVNIGTAALEQPEWCAEPSRRTATGWRWASTCAARRWRRAAGPARAATSTRPWPASTPRAAPATSSPTSTRTALLGPNLQLLRRVRRHRQAGRGQRRRHHARRHPGADDLVEEGVEGAIAGTALYEGRFTLEDASR